MWEYAYYEGRESALLTSDGVFSNSLDRKYEDGSTDLEAINEMGREGWEMVSAVPLAFDGHTMKLVYVFKRRGR